MNLEQVLGIVRHSLTFIGGMLIMKGTIDATEWAELSGSLIAVIGGIWSIVVKNKKSETSDK
jgi:flagellar motor component MotA|tara:strand:- start:539 stop:724 length:186 start_codon:yes stop_codon:yes gene_type:complete